MPPAEPSRARSLLTRLASLLGLGIGVVGAVVVARIVVRDWDEISEAVGAARGAPLAAALAIGLGGMAIIGVNWLHLARRSGGAVPPARGMAWYFVGQLGKYVPGGIWPIVGRAELAARGGVSRRSAYTSTALSMFATYCSAGVIGAAMLPWALGAPTPLAVGAPVLVAIGVAVAFHPVVTARLVAVAARLARRQVFAGVPTWREALSTLARHVPAWLAISAATWMVARSLGADVPLWLLIAGTPTAWLVGFVIIGLPGGLGVRESVFIAIVATQTAAAEAAAIALLARMVFIGVDIAGAALAVSVSSIPRRSRSTTGVR